MAIPFSAASAAYGQAQKLISGNKGLPNPLEQQAPGGPDFGNLVNQALNSVVESGKKSDQAGIDMINGKGSVVDMVTAVSETEMAMQSLVSVRDKVISAYEEIMRMPI
jgi:flagellar hook-basal body complex protein FliE